MKKRHPNNPMKGIDLHGSGYRLRIMVKGRAIIVPLDTKDAGLAITRAREFRENNAIAALQVTPTNRAETRALADRYIAFKVRLNIFSRKSARVNEDMLHEFARAVETIGAVSRAALERHYAALQARVAETTAQIHMRAIRAFLSWCVEEKLIATNPALGMKFAKIDRPARLVFCTAAQRDALIKNAPTDDLRFILYCGFFAGLRKNEIVEARVKWFDLHSRIGAVHVENTDTFRVKNGKFHSIPLADEFRDFLRGYLAGKTPAAWALKPGVLHGKGEYRYDFERPFRDYLNAERMRHVTAHVMRHTFASLHAQTGVSIFKIAEWLGDSVETTARHYAHLSPQDNELQRSIEASRMR